MSIKKCALIAMTVLATSGAACAGGLFGDGGIIRGSVGKFMDKHVEQPILTPGVRNLVVGGGTAIGGYYGGPAGAVMGGAMGHAINEAAAGHGRTDSHRSAPQGRMASTPQYGNFCMTEVGRVGPGPVNPLGAPCHTNTRFGRIEGYVSQ